jgi:hypothetical protein
MYSEDKEFILDLIEHINNFTIEKFDALGLKPIGDPDFKNEVHDTPSKFYLPGIEPKDNAVLMVSRKAHPDSIERAVNNSRLARSALSDQLAAVILEPIKEGRFRDLSFAVWPEHRPISNFRIIRKFQKRGLEPKVFSWLQDMTENSKVRNLDENFVEQHIRSPLECIVTNSGLSDNVRPYAAKALQQLETSQWIPVTTLQHSDFWVGNILLLKNPTQSPNNKFGFCIIDWGGALINGAPVFDLVRFCISSRVSLTRSRKVFYEYMQTTEIRPEELIYYLVCGLGLIGMDLGQFPEDRYLEMCEQNVSFIQKLEIKV